MQDLPFEQSGFRPADTDDQPVAVDARSGERGIIWLGVIGACLGLIAAAGVWGYALWRPWFEPWDKPWGALLVMTTPYPIALLVSVAGKANRTLAAIALAGCAVFSAFVIMLGSVGLTHIPAALFMLVGAALIISRPLGLSRAQGIAAVLVTIGAVALMLSGSATILARPVQQECIVRWELLDGRVLWRPINTSAEEPFVVAQQTPEGFRDDVKQLGTVCNLNSMTTREAAFGLAQIGAGALAALAVPMMAVGIAFLAPLILAVVLGIGAFVFQILALAGLLLVAIGAAIKVRSLKASAAPPDEEDVPAAPSEDSDSELWQRPNE
jgi:MFS family permease